MEIKLATQEDLNSINEIYNQAIRMKMATADTMPYSEEERLNWYLSHDKNRFPVYVAVDQDKVLAYMSLSAYRPRREALRHAIEISYFVAEGERGKGLGKSLLNFGIEVAKELGYRYIIAILLGHNQASIGLLKKFKFEEWGRMPDIAEFDGESYDHLYYGRAL